MYGVSLILAPLLLAVSSFFGLMVIRRDWGLSCYFQWFLDAGVSLLVWMCKEIKMPNYAASGLMIAIFIVPGGTTLSLRLFTHRMRCARYRCRACHSLRHLGLRILGIKGIS